MISDTYAIVHWVTDRQTLLSGIAAQIDKLLEGRTAGTFIIDAHGPYGSRHEDVKELPESSKGK